VTPQLPEKVAEQIRKAGLPTGGQHPFQPQLEPNQRGDLVIRKEAVQHGPKRGKRGYVDTQGRIWIKDRAHAGLPDHWDVQIDSGLDYIRVDFDGREIAP
jgi:hypothetical protein